MTAPAALHGALLWSVAVGCLDAGTGRVDKRNVPDRIRVGVFSLMPLELMTWVDGVVPRDMSAGQAM